MIARVKFEGIVKDGEKKYILPDYVDIHTPSIEAASETFKSWLLQGAIRGGSGIFHPLGADGEIKNIVVEGSIPEVGFKEKEIGIPGPKPEPETKPKKKGKKAH